MNQFKLLGQRIRAVRKAARLTQEQVAEKAGIAPNFLGYIERGNKRPSLEVTFALAKVLNVPVETFFRFDRTETDEKVLRRKIYALIEKSTAPQLQYTHSFLKYVIGP
jgi:transcriptional regulator with XRE-family HTH domain